MFGPHVHQSNNILTGITSPLRHVMINDQTADCFKHFGVTLVNSFSFNSHQQSSRWRDFICCHATPSSSQSHCLVWPAASSPKPFKAANVAWNTFEWIINAAKSALVQSPHHFTAVRRSRALTVFDAFILFNELCSLTLQGTWSQSRGLCDYTPMA